MLHLSFASDIQRACDAIVAPIVVDYWIGKENTDSGRAMHIRKKEGFHLSRKEVRAILKECASLLLKEVPQASPKEVAQMLRSSESEGDFLELCRLALALIPEGKAIADKISSPLFHNPTLPCDYYAQ
jgi:hypothetical protein